MKAKSVVLLVILALLLGSVVLPPHPAVSTAINLAVKFKFPAVKQVSPAELVEWWKSVPERKPPLLIDARTPAEYRVSHIAEAINIDMTAPDISALANVRRTSPVLVYDAVGIRGAALAEALRQQGYDDVSNLAGGIFRWANEGRPLNSDHGDVEVVHPWEGLWTQLLKSRYRAQPGQ